MTVIPIAKTPIFTPTIVSTGSISISSSPSGASIYIDGTYRGKTPATISNIPIGYHTIKLTKSDYKDYTETVRVFAGKTVSVIAVDIYLDPMICTKTGTNLNCRVDYKDSYGNPKSVQMKTKKVKVVCSIFLTESDINIGILKELLEKLPFRDSKVYQIQTDFEIDKLMEICKEVIHKHDVRHIRTFATKDKNTIETWYYGKTKVEKNDLIIKASVNTNTKSIEMFSATQTQESLTGILAELGHKLSKNQESIQQIINIEIKDSIIQRSNLLSFCDLDGKCTGDVVIEDSVIQRSQIGVEKK
ncbi:MAG: PEGA domain-containing protein [Methanosarcinales archaeon]